MDRDVNARYGRGAWRAVVVLAALLVLGGRSASAGEPGASQWAPTDQTSVRLISAAAATGSAEQVRLGLQFELAPGWKTYWRSPGDAGFPVSVDWTGSSNLKSAEMAWPAPRRFSLFGLETFGYESQVVFPITARLEQPGQAVSFNAKVDYLVCEEICIPYTAELSLDLPAGAATPTDHAQLIDRYMARVPGDGARQGLRLDQVAVGDDGGQPVLSIVARSVLAPFGEPDVFIEGPSGLYFSAPKVQFGDGGAVARLTVPVSVDEGAPALDAAELTLTLVDGERGLEQRVTPATNVVAGGGPSPAFLSMLLLALLGGLILNVMPCILPVLSLKLLGLFGHDSQDRRQVRAGFLASAAGILTAFLALAAALVILKQAGVAVGWGLQFQQPWFLIAMTLLLTLFAANLWGWLEVPMPGWIGRVAAAPTAGGLGGQFATGVFATLLATPCSAPFVGTAIGFALARDAGDILAIFAALGTGFAAPYLLVAAVPGIARLLPRPGRWMIVLRRILGALLAGTAVWLVSVLAAQVASVTVWVVAGLVAAIGVILWARHRLPDGLRLASPAAVGLLALLAFVAPAQFGQSRATTPAVDALWTRFDQAALAELVAQGKTVLVDVTADWCVTCLVNKRFVLESSDVVERLSADHVVAMQADWTKPDDGIARYLASHGRYGIPFNAIYGPGAPDGILLPELLSQDAVLEALRKAAGG